MQSEFLQKLIALVAKTGHTMVVPDPTTGKSYVVMDLPTYEQLLGVGEQPVAASPAPAAPEPASSHQEHPQPAQPPIAELPASPQQNLHFSGQQSEKMDQPAQGEASPSGDLTQEELLDKINRDIGDWKTAQERRRTDALRSAALRQDPGPAESQQPQRVDQPMFEEERFYLEPIE